MNPIVDFFRNTLSGFSYFIYVLVILFIIFAIIGYLVTLNHNAKRSMNK